MKLTINNNHIIIERLDSPKLYKDSTLMTHIKRQLQAQGNDVISKDLSKELGNLLSNGCYGIIARDRSYQIYYPNYCIDNAYKHYNQGKLILDISSENDHMIKELNK